MRERKSRKGSNMGFLRNEIQETRAVLLPVDNTGKQLLGFGHYRFHHHSLYRDNAAPELTKS